ncbi:TetR family transcriptional regulator [Saccharopolyspora erythraea NRRL 2338]|uniref:TetR-family transcriptional regulator n=2 Tax=Saccharopolyspora erythraea TaxID=1836 RepID=A4FJ79_SACEN|nr:TetR/AcrR family transcriptional regulator [Saccharopolyspora erythraea]EQD82933.1 TetR family transcriptional regulator [Saccharopolyspora erythraea D]PFG97773.1 TetR family transcriptional regulator [Saccharopolyspora erythraea NRRL 2338]QRK87917.1 TetR/AcrR family transcriptional regulator [Saccharopolyspora erythraea]CAM04104.1 TetR-family transcriptional regulator [Saccharopolyspora erythraea NRRL 2338]
MTDSAKPRARAADKRRRLTTEAARVLHEQGVERTTLADIARAADVPVGNVYYYFKTKDELVMAALSEHSAHLDELTSRLDQLPDPRDRLKALVEAWIDQRDVAARHGCPTGTLAVELDKRTDGTLDAQAGTVIRRLLEWAGHQFRALGLPDPDDLAVAFVSAYQGMSLLANALRDPDIMMRQGARLHRWLDSLDAGDQTGNSGAG